MDVWLKQFDSMAELFYFMQKLQVLTVKQRNMGIQQHQNRVAVFILCIYIVYILISVCKMAFVLAHFVRLLII